MAYLFPFAGDERRKPSRPVRRVAKPAAPEPEPDVETFPAMPPSLLEIYVAVCKSHNVKPSEMGSRSHALRIVAARRAFIWRAKKETAHSPRRIGEVINRDRTTVLHQYNAVEKGVATIDPFVGVDQNALREREVLALKMREAGMSFAEIGRRLGVDRKTATNYAAKCRMKLRRREV